MLTLPIFYYNVLNSLSGVGNSIIYSKQHFREIRF